MSDSPRRAVTVVIPVKNEDRTILAQTCYELRTAGYHTIVVDDGSTVPLDLATVRFDTSRGYGAALKHGIAASTTELVVTMDGDGQHLVSDVQRLEAFFSYFPHHAMVIGDRRVQERGKRYWGRKGLNWMASLFAGRVIPDLNSGLRIFRRSVALGYFPILCNGFSFTTSLTLSLLADGYSVDWLPIRVLPRRRGVTKVSVWKDGWTTLRYILWIGVALRTRSIRAWVRPATRWLLGR